MDQYLSNWQRSRLASCGRPAHHAQKACVSTANIAGRRTIGEDMTRQVDDMYVTCLSCAATHERLQRVVLYLA